MYVISKLLDSRNKQLSPSYTCCDCVENCCYTTNKQLTCTGGAYWSRRIIITLRTRGTGTDDGKSAFGSRVVTLDAPVNRINGSKLKCVDLSWIEPENDGFRTLNAKKAHHSPSCIAVHVSPRRRKQMSIVSESYFNRSWVPNYLSFHHNRTFPIRPFCDPQQRIRIVGSE